jgi:hypothetical protein
MTLENTLLSLCPVVGVAVLSGSVASHQVASQACAYDPVRITVAAQQAVKARLPKLLFPVFSYSSGPHTSFSDDRCEWTVLGHVEALTNDGTVMRLGWAINLRVNPGDSVSAPTVSSSIVF